MTSPLPPLPSITRLSPLIIRILGHNPSKYTLQGSNTYLIGSGPSRILLDTGEGKPQWRESLRQVLTDENCTIATVVLSHWHGDHVGGVEDVRDLLREMRGDEGGGVEIYKHRLPTDDPANGWLSYPDTHTFSTPGATLTAIHTPGHTSDHFAYHLHEESALFTSDAVLGHGTAVFEDLTAYMASLHRLSSLIADEGLGRVYPGHGEVVQDGGAKVREYISHREGREREVLEVLKKKEDGGREGWTSMEIVKVVYHAYPESLHGPAEGGVRLVLRKLEAEGRVVKEEDGSGGDKWRAVEEKKKESVGGKAAL